MGQRGKAPTLNMTICTVSTHLFRPQRTFLLELCTERMRHLGLSRCYSSALFLTGVGNDMLRLHGVISHMTINFHLQINKAQSYEPGSSCEATVLH
jgi:hypothetical protein